MLKQTDSADLRQHKSCSVVRQAKKKDKNHSPDGNDRDSGQRNSYGNALKPICLIEPPVKVVEVVDQ